MTVEEMRRRKHELGYTNQMISEMSGVPLGTVQKIFSGITKSPQWATLCALQSVLQDVKLASVYMKDLEKEGACLFEEAAPVYCADPKQGYYTIEDYYALPDERRVELIDGVIYDMGAPTSVHQLILQQLHLQLSPCVEQHPECEIFLAPCDVRLDLDNRTMVQPDIFITCHMDRITKKRIEGAPDFVIEITSPSSRAHDMFRKLNKYKFAGVREYWIVDPDKLMIIVHYLDKEIFPERYSFDDTIPVQISDGECKVDFGRIYKKIERYL